jgi:hypothetical protein
MGKPTNACRGGSVDSFGLLLDYLLVHLLLGDVHLVGSDNKIPSLKMGL